jgi:hypothetical protein
MSNQKVRLWTAAKVVLVALVLAFAIGQVISGGAVQPAYAGGCYWYGSCPTPTPTTPKPTPTPTPTPTVKKGNNGWGNGLDPTNPGSNRGGGVSQGPQGGPGSAFGGGTQSDTKSDPNGGR